MHWAGIVWSKVRIFFYVSIRMVHRSKPLTTLKLNCKNYQVVKPTLRCGRKWGFLESRHVGAGENSISVYIAFAKRQEQRIKIKQLSKIMVIDSKMDLNDIFILLVCE